MATRTQRYFAEQAFYAAFYHGKCESVFTDKNGIRVECEVVLETRQVLMNHGDEAVIVRIPNSWYSL